MNEIINFYEHDYIKKYNVDYLNPNYDKTFMKHPFYCGVIGPSGAGKTNMLMNLITRMQSGNDTWTHIHVVYKEMDNLYRGLEDMCLTCIDGQIRNKLVINNDKVNINVNNKKDNKKDNKKVNKAVIDGIHGNELITFYNDLNLLPTPENITQDGQQLIIFDDQINENKKKQAIIAEWFIRGRKTKLNGFSCIILSQSYFAIPKTIRLQFYYLLIIKLSDKSDLQLICKSIGKYGVDIQLLLYMYNDATSVLGNFLKIDLKNHDINKSFSHNFTEFYTLK